MSKEFNRAGHVADDGVDIAPTAVKSVDDMTDVEVETALRALTAEKLRIAAGYEFGEPFQNTGFDDHGRVHPFWQNPGNQRFMLKRIY